MNIVEIYNRYKECGCVTTDTRTLKGGEMFFALKGENFDGNEYALKALEAGAAYAVVNNSSAVASVGNERLIKVEDTLKTLQELARWHRSMTFVDGKPLTVVALTGTNGKTTTKELIREVLSVRYNVTATQGNLNNQIGVPLTLLQITRAHEMAIVEMGASHPGDIKELVDIAEPNYGLITNVGRAHLEGFGSFEGVQRTKQELYDYLVAHNGTIFRNTDNPYLATMHSKAVQEFRSSGVTSEQAQSASEPRSTKRTGIRIHAGNAIDHTEGCILVGEREPTPNPSLEGGEKEQRLLSSLKTLHRLCDVLLNYQNQNHNEEMYIEVSEPDPYPLYDVLCPPELQQHALDARYELKRQRDLRARKSQH